MNQSKKQSSIESGFTLIELLTVVAITGILAAIAGPQYSSYKSGAFDARAQVMLKAVATAEEAYFVDNSVYKSCNQSDCHSVLNSLQPIESGLTLQITATATGFSGTAAHSFGSGEIFTWEQ